MCRVFFLPHSALIAIPSTSPQRFDEILLMLATLTTFMEGELCFLTSGSGLHLRATGKSFAQYFHASY